MNQGSLFQRGRAWFYRFSWSSLILLIVFTSLPLLAKAIRTSSVAAPSLLPAFLLFGTWLVPEALRGLKLPFLTVPFLVTVTVLLITTGLSFFMPIFPVKGLIPASEVRDAIITLCGAVAVYLVVATYLNTSDLVRHSLRLVNLSGLAMIAWSLIQFAFILAVKGEFPEWMHTIQSWFSIRRLFHNRVTGFAYEPSWLAHQLNMVFLPYWLAAGLTNYTAHARRFGFLTAERILLVGGVGVLVLSFSRVGWLAFGLSISFVMIRGTIRLSNRIQEWILRTRAARPAIRRIVASLVFLAALSLYGAAALGALEIAGRFDPRLERFFERTENNPTIYHFANRLAFAERAVAWGTAWQIFNDHPVTGVGLGNAGFFFNEKMPTFGWLLVEINEHYFRQADLFNSKSLWLRLLAEGGLPSFTCLTAWIYLLWKSARALERDSDPLFKVIGLAGIFFLIQLAIEGFSIDSFALPFLWFTAGVLTAVTHQYLLKTHSPDAESSGSTRTA